MEFQISDKILVLLNIEVRRAIAIAMRTVVLQHEHVHQQQVVDAKDGKRETLASFIIFYHHFEIFFVRDREESNPESRFDSLYSRYNNLKCVKQLI